MWNTENQKHSVEFNLGTHKMHTLSSMHTFKEVGKNANMPLIWVKRSEWTHIVYMSALIWVRVMRSFIWVNHMSMSNEIVYMSALIWVWGMRSFIWVLLSEYEEWDRLYEWIIWVWGMRSFIWVLLSEYVEWYRLYEWIIWVWVMRGLL